MEGVADADADADAENQEMFHRHLLQFQVQQNVVAAAVPGHPYFHGESQSLNQTQSQCLNTDHPRHSRMTKISLTHHGPPCAPQSWSAT